MDDLDRLFRQLVDVLATEHPERLSTPLQLSELYQSILPYRSYRKQLGFETNEDYEMAVLRLLAGESDYATVEPDEVKEQLVLEAQAVNPNPGAFREFAAARVKLNEAAVRSVRGKSLAFAPPPSQHQEQRAMPDQWAQFAPPANESTAQSTEETDPAFEVIEPDQDDTDSVSLPPLVQEPVQAETMQLDLSCPNCNERLPTNRTVVFCPYCGGRVGPVPCPECGDEIEVSWRFCVSCGRASSSG